MMTRLGEGDGDSDKVEVTFTDQQMTIKLSGQFYCSTGEKWIELYYWAIQRSWFARVNALCNLS